MKSGASEIALKVEKKVRDFIRSELKLLLGLEKPEAPITKILDSDEIKVLKMWADVLKQRPHLMGNLNNKPSTPSVVPAVVQPTKAPEVPKLNKAVAPALPSPPKEGSVKEPAKRGRPRRIVEKEITNAKGETFKVKFDTTGQTLPQGNTGRIPPAQSAGEMEAQLATIANQQVAIVNSSTGNNILGTAIQHALGRKDE